jgi:hypothetical protein
MIEFTHLKKVGLWDSLLPPGHGVSPGICWDLLGSPGSGSHDELVEDRRHLHPEDPLVALRFSTEPETAAASQQML